ncbi:hypothetical protein [Saccharopolyspora sp. NPDC002376]
MFIELVEKRAFHEAALAVSSVMSQIVGAVTEAPRHPVLPPERNGFQHFKGDPAEMNPQWP